MNNTWHNPPAEDPVIVGPATTQAATNAPTPGRRVQLTAPGPAQARLLVNGHDLSDACLSATVHVAGGGRREMTVELRIDVLDVDTRDTAVRVPSETAAALVALGWTPPAEDRAW